MPKVRKALIMTQERSGKNEKKETKAMRMNERVARVSKVMKG
jgi:hypothetical protein